MTEPSSRLVLPDGTSYEGTLQLDSDGQPVVDMATCGACGFSWNDALITEITPVPAGRCPNEYGHPIAHEAPNPVKLNDLSITPKIVLDVIRYRDGQTIQQIARELWPDDVPHYWRRLLKSMLTQLHREGRIETYRERSGSPLRYRKPEPLDWPQLSALFALVESTDLEGLGNLFPRDRHLLILAKKDLQAMIESHAEVEAERLKDWVSAECIWRIEFNRSFGQTDAVLYSEHWEGETEAGVRRQHRECLPSGVYVVESRRANESDVDELLEMIREEEGW